MSFRRSRSFVNCRKLVIVGNGLCGKTALLTSFKDNRFLTKYEATVFESYLTHIQLDGKNYELVLNDTAGEDNYDNVRPLSYPDANIILICFNVDSSVSAMNVMEKWMPEIRHFCRLCPVILVACKTDLRTDYNTIRTLKSKGEKMISTEDGKQIATYIKADAYMECSAKTAEGVEELFLHAVRLSLMKRPSPTQCMPCILQ